MIVSRAQWQARPRKSFEGLNPAKVKGACLHYTASAADWAVSHSDCYARVRSIQNYHMDKRGYVDIAYNFLVCQHGVAFEGRGWGVRSAGQGGQGSSSNPANNDNYYAFCFLGTDVANRIDFTTEAMRAMSGLIVRLRERHPGATAVLPHSALVPTGCPGDEIRDWVEAGTPYPPHPSPVIWDVVGPGDSPTRSFTSKGNAVTLLSERLVDAFKGEVVSIRKR